MKQIKRLTLVVRLSLLVGCIFLAACNLASYQVSSGGETPAPTTLNFPDRSSPETTLRTFWWAIKSGRKEIALACVDRAKVAEGRHGVDIDQFITEQAKTDTSHFEYVGSGPRISIRSPNHNMDYELEQAEDGQWVIVSIHP